MVKPEALDRKFKEIAERNQLNLFGATGVPLPKWSEHRRGTPNSCLRCALFAATKERGGKMEEQILAGQKDIVVKYSGPQLNQSDLDVWEAIVHLARDPEHKGFGKLCGFTTYEILMALGHKNTGNTDHKWVDSIIKRLNKAHIEVVHMSQPDITYFGYLIEGGKKTRRQSTTIFSSMRVCLPFTDRRIGLQSIGTSASDFRDKTSQNTCMPSTAHIGTHFQLLSRACMHVWKS